MPIERSIGKGQVDITTSDRKSEMTIQRLIIADSTSSLACKPTKIPTTRSPQSLSHRFNIQFTAETGRNWTLS
jgi:hypothetical protein